MKQTVTFNLFRQAFAVRDRLEQFPKGLPALYDYLTEYEEATGEQIELDVIALCCEFTEYNLDELPCEFAHLIDDGKEPKTIDEWVDRLRDETDVIPVDGQTLIIQNF